MSEPIAGHIFLIFNYFLEIKKVVKKSKKLGLSARNPNFPSELSKYMAKRILVRKWNLSDDDFINYGSGNLGVYDGNRIRKIEVKCFSSNGPISFEPSKSWRYLVLIDARKCTKNKFRAYLVCHSNTSKTIGNLIVNKKQTFADHADNNRRPRIGPDNLLAQLGNRKKFIARGSLEELVGA